MFPPSTSASQGECSEWLRPEPLGERPRVAVVGASGLVGEVLLGVLRERAFPLAELVPLASERSAGTTLRFGGDELTLRRATPEALDGVDLVFFAATGELSRDLAPEALRRGAWVIDKSSTWRMHERVPLVVPEVNGAEIASGAGLLACPNCTTIGLVTALAPLHRAVGLTRLTVTTLQAASGAGRAGANELQEGERAAQSGRDIPARVFPAPLARNVVPVCDDLEPDGSSGEEHKLMRETRKILDAPDLRVHATCVRVPVHVGHAASVLIETERALTRDEARELLSAAPGVRVVSDSEPLEAVTSLGVAGTDEVRVGRIRCAGESRAGGAGLLFWQVSDNLRKGAATNAVQIAESLLPASGR